MRRTLPVLAVAASLLVALAGCGSKHNAAASPPSTPASGSGSTAAAPAAVHVVIGSANFPENEILADIYADALRSKGVSVTTKLDIGSREIYFPQLEKGAISLFPEYNGALLDYLKPSATAVTTAAVNQALAKALPASLEALPTAQAQDKDSLTVTQAFATAHHLTSIGDLKAVEGQVTIGAPAEFATREEGLVGLKKLYGIVPRAFKPLDESGPLTIAALNDGTIQAGDIFTTDPSVAKYHFVALADPLGLFAAQNIVPIINRSVATPTVVTTIDAVDADLTTSVLVQLVGGVVNDHIDAASVAAQFISQAGLS
jgi:osmoprotectant transport system substrate-binding protein